MRRLAILALVLVAAFPGSAFSVWGGAVDTAHPSVGAMYFDFMDNGVAVPDGLICAEDEAEAVLMVGRSQGGLGVDVGRRQDLH